MGRTRKGRAINGVLLVDKPTGVSSNFVVQKVKRIFYAKKAGHTGALDPLATGLLPICLGEATKFSQFLLDADKSYLVSAKLGERTDTSDSDGEIVETSKVQVSEAKIKEELNTFLGKIKQVPSMFSALKHEGKPLYHYARQGIVIDRPARDIEIYNIDWRSLKNNILTLNVSCSKGTYIRSLIDDLGQNLGCGAHVVALRRTGVAHFDTSKMMSFKELDKLDEDTDRNILGSFNTLDALLLPMDIAISRLDKVNISETDAKAFMHGQSLDLDSVKVTLNPQCFVRIYHNDLFLGLAECSADKRINPKRLVVYES
ncbi:tRNA pseudouridine(55) synthase TruB [Glaciecola petra]|uniref:tRNA pseudouridine synthase B n=1 Tax=Glaciecola petra TaxID=3075602 RepID=A0ABU2ZN85_9ALTE|nr:tRNA pseudouridine(55) synthase TruB [Aestuariibacter sp. P117]MDT0594091.1 tRNA pseudouridine(55) synthase TruB [Aestuariibacter sp. P117]